jgi:hypothetical protein
MLKKLASKSLLFYVAVSLYLLIAIYVLIAITDVDEDLSAELATELSWTEPVFDKKNAFYTFLGLTQLEAKVDLWQAGWEIAEADFENFKTLDNSIWGRNVPRDAKLFKLSCNSGSRSCISQNISQASEAREWLKKNNELAVSVSEIVYSNSFYEQISLKQNYVASWYLLNAVRQANWAKASELWSQSQDVAAIEMIRPYLKFCRSLLKTSSTLQTRTIAISCVNNDMRLLAEWYLLRPNQQNMLSKHLASWLKPLALDEVQTRKPLIHEVRLYSKSGNAFIKSILETANVESQEELFNYEKMNSRRLVALFMVNLTKPNDIARAAHKKFEGLLLWAEMGVALSDIPFKANRPKPFRSYLPRGLIGSHILPEIPLEEYEYYIHNAHSPLMNQILLKAVIFCSQKISNNNIENCLKSDLTEYKGPVYRDSAKWYPDQKFLWLPSPNALIKKHGEIRMYLDL